MATDWAVDVKKYAANADDAAIAGIVRYCGIALRNRDSAMIAFSDKTETDRVRTNFLQKKLALPHPQSELDAAIARVGDAMKGDRTKNRVTVYYLLAQEFDQLATFVSKTAGETAGKTASKAADALPLAATAVAPKTASKAVPKAVSKVRAAKPVSAVPAVKPSAKAAKAPAAAPGATAPVAATKPAKPAAAKPAAAKPAAVKSAAVKTPVKAAAAKPAAKPAAVTTKKSAPTKAAVSTGAAAPVEAKADTPATTGTIAAATALGGAAIAAAAGGVEAVKDVAADGVEAVKDAAAKVAGLVTDTDSSPVVHDNRAPAEHAGPAAAALADRPALAATAATATPAGDGSGMGWLYWVLGALVLLALLWYVLNRGQADETRVAAVQTEAAAAVVPLATPVSDAAASGLAAAPAEGSGSVQIPAGAGVTSELRGDKPVVKVYFDTGKTDLAAAFAGAAGGLKSYLSAHPGTVLNVSGYSDPSGNAAANAGLSKNRAKVVQAALVAAGIPEGSARMVKPDSSADASVPREAARRVEVVVR